MTVGKKIAKAAKTMKSRAKQAATDLSAKLDDLPKTIDARLEKLPGKLQKLGDKVETAFDAVSTEIDRVGRSVLGVRTQVVFEAHAVTRPGERVVVTGNVPELGDFRPENALVLDGSGYPLWTGSIALVSGVRVEYKYVRANEDGSFTWEVAHENRALSVGAQGRTSARDHVDWT